MTIEIYTTRQELGIHRFTGSIRGLVFTNERETEITDEEGRTTQAWEYDIFEVSNATNPNSCKDEIVRELYPNGDEFMLLRKTITKMLKDSSLYDTEEYANFKAYNEIVESLW